MRVQHGCRVDVGNSSRDCFRPCPLHHTRMCAPHLQSGRQWWRLLGGSPNTNLQNTPINIWVRAGLPAMVQHTAAVLPLCAICSLFIPVASPLPAAMLQSEGRANESVAGCPTYVSAASGCGTSLPSLAVAPSPDTKWIFEPAGGSILRYYIRMNVSWGTDR